MIDASPCPLELVDDGGLVLRASGDAPSRLEVEPPEVCVAHPGRCRWVGALTAVGPLLAAIIGGPEGELPVDVWLGAALGGERITFVGLWWGDPSVVDRTEVGPVYALAPALCGDSLVLRPAPRLPEAERIEPPALLVELGGEYVVKDGALTRGGPTPSGACEPVAIELP